MSLQRRGDPGLRSRPRLCPGTFVLATGAAAACLLLATGCWLAARPPPVAAEELPAVRRVPVIVRETAGIRRFGYPVGVALSLPQPAPDADHFRLLENGKPVPAQFQRADAGPRGGELMGLDFASSPGPYETREYVVEYGPGVRPGPQPVGGMTVETQGDLIRVHSGTELEFAVPRDLLGLLRRVRARTTEYLRPGSAGLLIRYQDNITYRAGGFGPYGVPTRAEVVKAGPLAATLRFASTEALRGGRSVASVVVMDFSRFKSWVRVSWTVDDGNDYVAGLGAEVDLNLRGDPTLVDFGAGTLVYTHLHRGEAATLRAGETAGPAWEVLTGRPGALTPYVLAPRNHPTVKAEGWAHVMDGERCTAVAVEGFAGAKQVSAITVRAAGRLQVWKQFAPRQAGASGAQAGPAGTRTPLDDAGRANPKQLVFWLHFVPMPVQVGAATSPQAMLAPLQVELGGGGK